VSLAEDGLPPLRDVVRRHDLLARKALGQNFLFDLNLCRRIARAAGPLTDCTVVEIGPGPGGLTRALLAEGAAQVIAVERDRRFLPALAEIAAHWPGRLEILEADALGLDYLALLAGRRARIAANLPYNIGTELVVRWLSAPQWPPWFLSATVMLQLEVAQRLAATPDDNQAYGRLSVLAGWRSRSRILFEVPAAAFTPPPKVTSAVVAIAPDMEPAPCGVGDLERVTAAAFGMRRKMLRQSLKSLFADTAASLAAIGIDPTARAETLGIEAYVRLANLLAAGRRETAAAAGRN
jgi:16S rRNA (adenine1518-N6/adenine1519-N6)-dimethyltransferase